MIADINSPIVRIVIVVCMIAMLFMSLAAVKDMDDSNKKAIEMEVTDEN